MPHDHLDINHESGHPGHAYRPDLCGLGRYRHTKRRAGLVPVWYDAVMAHRYLGTAEGDRYITDNPDSEGENVAFRMRPERWLSQDQGTGRTAR